MPSVDYILLGLIERQDRILAHLDESEKLAQHPSEEAVRALAASRWQLVRLMLDYQMYKHRRVFDPVIAAGEAASAPAARAMKQRCILLGDEFKAHVAHWSAVSVIGCWPDYLAAKRDMVAQLRLHILTERDEAHALLGRPRGAGTARSVAPPV